MIIINNSFFWYIYQKFREIRLILKQPVPTSNRIDYYPYLRFFFVVFFLIDDEGQDDSDDYGGPSSVIKSNKFSTSQTGKGSLNNKIPCPVCNKEIHESR